ncbi:uncharacterized protein TRAVEDRAFT_23597 [Trametes versicolor FP-101664 SS1]|uniref:uncharacterized protein n=1 Tax=Trametes versicolor (strain FP-101664) TaxID=717944 RepID=UPI0004623486|nr:uncharacterized protein TRAVEDRAFT_23597 [Trametes versicolor FP-101664 SS1]EIW54591.1 hypothetical protein TRAVEDRAFT_23597 [Trametes versicolor FP-101664 SS1]
MRLRECALEKLIDEVAEGVVIDPGRLSGGSTVDEEQVDEEVGLLLADEVVGKQRVADDMQPSVAENHDDVSEVEGREIELPYSGLCNPGLVQASALRTMQASVKAILCTVEPLLVHNTIPWIVWVIRPLKTVLGGRCTTRSITETKEHELEAERPAAVERQGEEQCPELWLKLGRQWQLASAGILAKWVCFNTNVGKVGLPAQPTHIVTRIHWSALLLGKNDVPTAVSVVQQGRVPGAPE